jgi:hypothetical protein
MLQQGIGVGHGCWRIGSNVFTVAMERELSPMARTTASWAALGAALISLGPGPAQAGPVICTTTYEAPLASGQPVEVTRCGVLQTTAELIDRRFFSYTSPYARGVDITHQITDLLGISMGGGDGTKVMGLGFPDQTIIWDGSAVENTYRALLEEQSPPLPLRVSDLPSSYGLGLYGSSPTGRR